MDILNIYIFRYILINILINIIYLVCVHERYKNLIDKLKTII